jgi:hypothetical protein
VVVVQDVVLDSGGWWPSVIVELEVSQAKAVEVKAIMTQAKVVNFIFLVERAKE